MRFNQEVRFYFMIIRMDWNFLVVFCSTLWHVNSICYTFVNTLVLSYQNWKTMMTNYLNNPLTEHHLTLPEGLLNLDPIYPVLRSGVDSVPCGGKLYGRLLQLYTSHIRLKSVYSPDTLSPVGRCEDYYESTADEMVPTCFMLLKVTPFCIA